jgi:hypothetical protein
MALFTFLKSAPIFSTCSVFFALVTAIFFFLLAQRAVRFKSF